MCYFVRRVSRSDIDRGYVHMMYMFCGDSHVLQFYSRGFVEFSLNSFAAATMKGLATDRSRRGHRQAILALAAVPRQKVLLLMFGNVDLDATWFRSSILDGELDEEAFFHQRLDALTAFVKDCQSLAGDLLRRTCVLLPHLPSLTDQRFVHWTAAMTGLEKRHVIELAATQDCSHLPRCRRTSRFNDYICQNLPSDGALAVYRIDDQMADETGLVLPTFLRQGRVDHHADPAVTLSLWCEVLKDEVPALRRLAGRQPVTQSAQEVKSRS
jgi:hypothetical protein